MKNTILPALRLTAVLVLLFAGVYTGVVWAIAQLAPNGGLGNRITVDGKIQYTDLGQSFTEDRYFQSRPSAVNYNAAGSAGSNKAPSNAEYLALVQARADTFLVHNPGISKAEIPVDLVTASGSGLDPHISVQAARVQVKRVARLRHISEERLQALVDEHIEKPWLGLFGPQKINVLELNLALDTL